MSIYSRSPSPSRDLNHGSGSDVEGEDDRRSNHSSGGRSRSGDEGASPRRRASDPENSEDEEDRKKREKEKKKASKPRGPVRRQMISEDMLSGPKGLSKLNESFKDFEFGGKGRETEDLSRMLNKIEQWVHTLHPKHPFDQCLERIEFLGNKKRAVKTYVKKMRMGLLPTTSEEIVDGDVLAIVDQVFDDDDDIFQQFNNEGEIVPNQQTNNESDFPDFDDELELVQPAIIIPQPQRPPEHEDFPDPDDELELVQPNIGAIQPQRSGPEEFPDLDDELELVQPTVVQPQRSSEHEDYPAPDDELELVQPNIATTQPQRSSGYEDLPSFEEHMELDED